MKYSAEQKGALANKLDLYLDLAEQLNDDVERLEGSDELKNIAAELIIPIVAAIEKSEHEIDEIFYAYHKQGDKYEGNQRKQMVEAVQNIFDQIVLATEKLSNAKSTAWGV